MTRTATPPADRPPAEPVPVPAGDRRAKLAIAAIVLLGVLLRLRTVAAPGFPTDVGTFMAWAERLAEVGPASFYQPGYFSDYPPGFLYVLWLLGSLFDGEALRLAVKSVSIPADIGIALLAARVAWRHGGQGPAVLAAGLWMLAPAQVFAGPYWGQVDAVGTLPLLAALLAAGGRRWGTAGVLAGLATMIKPQFGIGLLVVGAAATFILMRERRPRPLLVTVAAAGLVVMALALPFGLFVDGLIDLLRNAAGTYPYTSLYAFNVWSVIGDFWQSDTAYVAIGGVLLVLGLIGSVVSLWWRRDTAALLAAGAIAAMAFYFLPTRAHERYLFPAFALLLPLAALRGRLVAPYVVLAVGFFVSLFFAFTRYPQNDLAAPAFLEATLFRREGQIALALLMLGTAALVAWRLVRGEASLERTMSHDLSAAPAVARGWRLPDGLRPGHPATRRDVIVALVIALLVLVTRAYRLDQPRDMYFDEVYHARTAFELLAQREPYEWTHPHLAKEIMALGILAFGDDRVVATEPVPERTVAFAVAGDGTRAYLTADGAVLRAPRGETPRSAGSVGGTPVGLAFDGATLVALTSCGVLREPFDVPAALRCPAATQSATASFAVSNGRAIVGTPQGVQVWQGDAPPRAVPTAAVALTVKPDGTELYVLDPQGAVHVIDPQSGNETRVLVGGAPGTGIAYALGPNRVFVARRDEPALDVYELEGGRHETVPLGNARTGTFASGATSLAVVPRTQFLYALADGRAVVVETHGASPFAAIPVHASFLGIDGEGDKLVAASPGAAQLIETGRHALAWRIPGVLAAALLAFALVLLARRLFASRVLPLLVGFAVLFDGSMFAQARIGMNDIYVALFIVAGWYFIVAAHRPRRSAVLDVVVAGVLLGFAAAAKWAAVYTLAGVFVASVGATALAYERGRAGQGGPLDLFAGRGRNAALLFASFAAIPAAIYLASYQRWFGGPMTPFGWDLVELTRQMYWYHSGLTAPHPAGAPWWTWPLMLKPVYWYFGQSSNETNAYIYDAGNVVLFWGALAATAWCAIAAVRARSIVLGFVVFALLVQYVAWIPISRVLFFYHFFTALPFYLLALAAALAALWETRRREVVALYAVVAAGAWLFFYPFTSGLPVPASEAGAYFILPTWQYDCQFYPSFTCDVPLEGGVGIGAVLARATVPLLATLAGLAVASAAASPALRDRARAWAGLGTRRGGGARGPGRRGGGGGARGGSGRDVPQGRAEDAAVSEGRKRPQPEGDPH